MVRLSPFNFAWVYVSNVLQIGWYVTAGVAAVNDAVGQFAAFGEHTPGYGYRLLFIDYGPSGVFYRLPGGQAWRRRPVAGLYAWPVRWPSCSDR